MSVRRADGGDAIVFTTGLHWIVLAPAIVCASVGAVVQRWGTSDVLDRLGVEGPTAFDLDRAIIVAAGIVAGALLASALWRLLSTRLVVLSSGVRWEQGGFRPSRVVLGFGSIQSVRAEQGLLGRILGYGTVTVEGRNGIGRRRQIARPAAFRKACNDQMSTWLCRDLATDPRRRQAAAR